jgi:hypothetical protein
VARLQASPGTLHRCPTTDRWTTKDEANHPQDLSRPADASRSEEPGARTAHAGLWAGGRRVTGGPIAMVLRNA